MPQSMEQTQAPPDDISMDATQAIDPDTELTSPGGPAANVRPGDSVGRYVVLSRLGAGAMGVVFAAYDPQLDRKVALKLVHPAVAMMASSNSSEPTGRLLREAQALAKLSHPNIVGVHDVGTMDDRVWIAMEFVDGQTLGDWAATETRRWPEILAVITAAGQGLAAAHEAGLLHRDFKPDNVMVGTDGRVRVMDFGLARVHQDEEVEPPKPLSDSSALKLQMTQEGALIGTPAYMSPEQFGTDPATTASDQFALCVTLWELLYGQRPFKGSSMVELMANVIGGKMTPVPNTSEIRAIPMWLERACRRGLSSSPTDRFASVEALLHALEHGRSRAGRRRVLGVAAGVLAIGVGLVGARQWAIAQRTAACESAGAELLSTSWDDDARAELRRGLVRTGIRYADATADKVMPWLDEHAEAWADARTQSCMDAQVHERWDAETLERSLWCLDDRRFAFEALVGELSEPQEHSVSQAVAAAGTLESVDPCRDAAQLARMPDPPEQRDEVQSVRRDLSRAGALLAAGSHPEGLEVAEAALAEATALSWPPLVADARGHVGRLLSSSGRYEDAENALEDAYFEATKAGATETATEIAMSLVHVVGIKRAHYEEGFQWARHADAGLVEFDAPDDGLRRATYSRALAQLHLEKGEYDRAQPLYERALEIRTRVLGPDHPQVAWSTNDVANIHTKKGAFDEAMERYQRAMEIHREALGPDHPDVAQVQSNIAKIHFFTNRYPEAMVAFREVLATDERIYGPEHPELAETLNNIAIVQDLTGEHDAARKTFERALAIRENALGPEHPEVAMSIANLGTFLEAKGKRAEARPLHERALRIWENALGPRNEKVATSAYSLGLGYLNEGDWDHARPYLERALDIWTEALGPDHRTVSRALTAMAELELEVGRPAIALQMAARAVTIRESGPTRETDLAQSQFMLARALWDAPVTADGTGQDRARARTLGERARATFDFHGEGAAHKAAQVAAWIEGLEKES
ncbi:MAG: tetratricopeptide repeat-containing serine/threonine-protein kinase [Myxococcota bacterium]